MRTSRLVIPTTGSAVEVELVVAGAAVVAGPVDNATSINAVRVDDKVYIGQISRIVNPYWTNDQ